MAKNTGKDGGGHEKSLCGAGSQYAKPCERYCREHYPDHRTEGFCFHLVGCPIAKHAKEHGYEELLPYLCRTDHYLAELMHAQLIRTQTEALGGDCCDYWYVGDKSPALADYAGLEQI